MRGKKSKKVMFDNAEKIIIDLGVRKKFFTVKDVKINLNCTHRYAQNILREYKELKIIVSIDGIFHRRRI